MYARGDGWSDEEWEAFEAHQKELAGAFSQAAASFREEADRLEGGTLSEDGYDSSQLNEMADKLDGAAEALTGSTYKADLASNDAFTEIAGRSAMGYAFANGDIMLNRDRGGNNRHTIGHESLHTAGVQDLRYLGVHSVMYRGSLGFRRANDRKLPERAKNVDHILMRALAQ